MAHPRRLASALCLFGDDKVFRLAGHKGDTGSHPNFTPGVEVHVSLMVGSLQLELPPA